MRAHLGGAEQPRRDLRGPGPFGDAGDQDEAYRDGLRVVDVPRDREGRLEPLDGERVVSLLDREVRKPEERERLYLDAPLWMMLIRNEDAHENTVAVRAICANG